MSILEAAKGNILSRGMGVVGGLLARGASLGGVPGQIIGAAAPYIMQHGAGYLSKGLDYLQEKGSNLLGKIKSKWIGEDNFKKAMSTVGKLHQEFGGNNIGVPSGGSVGEGYKSGLQNQMKKNMGQEMSSTADTPAPPISSSGTATAKASEAVFTNPVNGMFA